MNPLGTCPRCGVKMESGRLLRHRSLIVDLPVVWQRDRGGRAALPVLTLRCPGCGLLESYAPDAETMKPGQESRPPE